MENSKASIAENQEGRGQKDGTNLGLLYPSDDDLTPDAFCSSGTG